MREIDSISKLISENESEIEKIQDPDGPYDLSKKASEDMVEHLERSNDKLKALNTKLTKMSNELKGLEDELKIARDSHDRKKVREINKKISDKSSELKQMKKDARLDFKGYDSEGYNQGTRRDIVSCAFGQIGKRIHNFVYKEDTRHGDFAWKINKAIARFNLRHPLLGTLASGITFMSLSMLAVIAFGNPVIGMVASAVAIGRRIPQFVNGDSKLVRNYHIKKGGYKENIENSCAEYNNCLDIRKSVSSIDIDNLHKKVAASGHDDALGSDENAKKHKKIKEKLNSVNLGDRSDDNILNLNALLSECQICAALLDDEDKAKLKEIENFILGNYGDLVKKDIVKLSITDIENELEQLKHRKERIEAGSVRIMSDEARNAISAKLHEIEEYQKELEKRKDFFAKMPEEIREALFTIPDTSKIDEEISRVRTIASDDVDGLNKLVEDLNTYKENLSAFRPYQEDLLPQEKEKLEKIRILCEVCEEKLKYKSRKVMDKNTAIELLNTFEKMFEKSGGNALDDAIKNNDLARVAVIDYSIGEIWEKYRENMDLISANSEIFTSFDSKIEVASRKITALMKASKKPSPEEKLRELVDSFDMRALDEAMRKNDRTAIEKMRGDIYAILYEYNSGEKAINDSALLKRTFEIIQQAQRIDNFVRTNPVPITAVPVPPIDFPSHKVTASNAGSVDVKLISGESMGIDGYIATSVQFRGKDGRFIGKQYNDVGGKPIVFTSNDADDIVRELNNYFDGFTGTVNVRYSSKASKR